MSWRFRHYLSFLLEKGFIFRKHLFKSFESPLFTAAEYKGMKKLNLACSDRIIPGWINVDVRDIPGIDYVVDVRDLSIFPDASFDIVRASHILEHFYVDELENVFSNWNRVLRPGGWMIICVPDFNLTLLRYLINTHSINPCLISEFGTAVLSQIYGFGYTGPEHCFYKHRMVYNRKGLTAVMKKYGKLRNIRSFNFFLEEPCTAGILDDSTNVFSLNLAGRK